MRWRWKRRLLNSFTNSCHQENVGRRSPPPTLMLMILIRKRPPKRDEGQGPHPPSQGEKVPFLQKAPFWFPLKGGIFTIKKFLIFSVMGCSLYKNKKKNERIMVRVQDISPYPLAISQGRCIRPWLSLGSPPHTSPCSSIQRFLQHWTSYRSRNRCT